jgi:hypothetical protein
VFPWCHCRRNRTAASRAAKLCSKKSSKSAPWLGTGSDLLAKRLEPRPDSGIVGAIRLDRLSAVNRRRSPPLAARRRACAPRLLAPGRVVAQPRGESPVIVDWRRVIVSA